MATTTRIYLGNDWDIHRTNIKARGITIGADDGVAVRGFLSLTKDGDPITPVLDIAELDWEADGEVIGTLQGYDLDDALLALWETAAAAGEKLKVYERVIVEDQDYSDVRELTVERDRPVPDAE